MKNIVFVFTVSCAALLLGACGGDTADQSANTEFADNATVTPSEITEPTPESSTEPQPAPVSQPTPPPAQEPTPPSRPAPEPIPESDPAPAPEPTSEPEPTPEPSPIPEPVEPPAPLPEPEDQQVPDISSLQFVRVNDDSSFTVMGTLLNASTLDLNDLDFDTLNITAETSDLEKTGSVQFRLEGPGVLIDRIENTYEYTLASTETHLRIDQNALPGGEYTLEVVAYELPNGGGESGNAVALSFSVVGIEVPKVEARDDEFFTPVNEGVDREADTGLGVNDVFDETMAVFDVVEQPDHGELTIFEDGGFSYTPDQDFVGEDSFRYDITDGEDRSEAEVLVRIEGEISTAEGFTPITPSSDSLLIYVSSTEGDDGNDCLSPQQPCATLNAAFAKQREGYPDHVYLRRGDVWRHVNLRGMKSGRSVNERAVVAFYGDAGPRPRLEVDDELYREDEIANLAIIGIEMSAYKMDPSHPEFTGQSFDRASLFFLGGTENILIEDCRFNFAELLFQGWQGKNSKNAIVRRNMFTGSYYNSSSFNRNSRPSNMFMDSVDGALIEENVFDYGGWYPGVPGAGSNQFNHNVYIQYTSVGNGVTFRKNIVTRAASHGVHGRPGGLYEDNFFARNAVALQMGYWNQPLDSDTFAIARSNVVTEGRSMVKGDRPCSGDNLCTPALWGIHIDELGDGQFRLENNVVHSLLPDNDWRAVFSGLVRTGIRQDDRATYIDNHSWHWNTDTQGDERNYTDPDRTLADYNASIGGSRSFDEFMDIVKQRPLQSWDDRYSAESINDYIREGYSP